MDGNSIRFGIWPIIIVLTSLTVMSTSSFAGRLSNIHHNKEHIGSPNRLRELGRRPRSGLEQRKSGRFGRKIYALPPVKIIPQVQTPEPEILKLTLNVTWRPPNLIT